jgi:hypothetical protein
MIKRAFVRRNRNRRRNRFSLYYVTFSDTGKVEGVERIGMFNTPRQCAKRAGEDSVPSITADEMSVLDEHTI